MTVAFEPITSAGRVLHANAAHHPRLSADTLRPYIGIVGVLIGAILSFLGSRVTSFGLADLRGGLHAGFDEGAWMTTSFGVGQMLVGVACPYLGAIFGVRRVLLPKPSSSHRMSPDSSTSGASARVTVVSCGVGVPTQVRFTLLPTESKFPSTMKGAHSRR